MHKSENNNVINRDLVYEPIVPDEHFSNIRYIAFRYHSASLGEGPQRPRSCQFLAQITHLDTPTKQGGKALPKRGCERMKG